MRLLECGELNEPVILGIDCAVEPKKTGLAVGDIHEDVVRIRAVTIGQSQKHIINEIAGVCNRHSRVLLALDAPLGWPRAMAEQLAGHRAGRPLREQAALLFSRVADREVHRRLNQKPLDVGADRIARTALSTLNRLEQLRVAIRQEIPLVWNTEFDGCGAIEVYPAALLVALGINPKGYKKPEHQARRVEIVEKLAGELNLEAVQDAATVDADLLDAALCVLAGADFLRGNAAAPKKEWRETVEREGWIWVRRRVGEPPQTA
ncbi:MAG: DUF429 domain-containing protein [Caldilineae bacterium]|nr:MAG: DUF429 domain-containing protein [Caldilineae bacterium]